MKQLLIDFLYLDLNTCERCMATDETLKQALKILSGVFDTLGLEVKINSVNITSRELAEEYRFISSPTIRVNGVDICNELVESECADCGDLCGDSVDCRVFVYEGKNYEQPPVPMIVDGILKAIYGGQSQGTETYKLPDNLDKFFSGKNSCCDSNCCCGDTPSSNNLVKDEKAEVSQAYICYCNHVTKNDIINAIRNKGARTVDEVIKLTGAMKDSNCAANNPKGVCCYPDIVETFNYYKESAVMKTMSIYEPAMCCETGICGVGVDPELLRISTVFNNLQKNGITAARFNLNSAPQAFINNTDINRLIMGDGVESLPATVIDGKIVKTKAYPTNEEIAAWLEIPASYLEATENKKADGGCCCSEGCC
ncbi:arsenite efflux transporter metallochaperone ArsD [Lacrimispora saccharolytica]|uniref:Arsenical resistance operon trans-acting repressor ArsD n=1 Tax=Lacrimispora saccharolytica (strain ATCC 35040 / DSM 2544 / NRCC 2533 / WM1) TaxID=610130 RepID=D9RAP3_LACSW|nr:arsenite efflux transporter metallochaperone ArsD [Lacrimispora saccharolytica]ADL06090.1 Arsenical resistance operon trans-acting repressor ArsD [[Clostridium] saccharolyticum WM1]QRV19795.1 arsenite efflux transporter metallochaperone ArsD [Lacrimispora saccharolytica]